MLRGTGEDDVFSGPFDLTFGPAARGRVNSMHPLLYALFGGNKLATSASD